MKSKSIVKILKSKKKRMRNEKKTEKKHRIAENFKLT